CWKRAPPRGWRLACRPVRVLPADHPRAGGQGVDSRWQAAAMAVSEAGHAARPADSPSARQIASLRGASFGALVMLIVQFAIGIVVNLYVTVPVADQGGFLRAIGKALTNPPAALASHAGRGLLIVLSARALVVRALRVGHTAVAVLSIVGLLAIVAAAVNGVRFVAEG